MNNVQIYIFFQFLPHIIALLYPCEYIDSNESRLKCDLCKCLSYPSIYSSTNLCSLTPSNTCINSEFNFDDISSEKQIEFHNFNYDLFKHEQLCLIKNFTQLKFFHILYNQTSTCLLNKYSLQFINSIIINPNFFFVEKLIFFNTTFEINYLNLTSTKILILHSTKFLIQPFILNSLSLLTHLTITYTNNYHLIGLFNQLIYLNLSSTKLNDKQLNQIFSQLNLPDLITLILSNNYLTIITNKFPSTIRYLDLSNNQIKSLDYYSFKTLYSLNILNLSSNSPLEIQQDTFTRIPYLEILDLSYTLPTLPFEDLFLPLQKLRHLNISGNLLDTLPQLPVPYDAHIIENYDQHLPVLYVDLSNNNLDKFDFEIFSISSTQDKYILSFNLNYNRLKTISILSNDTKRRGPFIELDINNNPLECDCNLYETIFHTTTYQKQSTFNSLSSSRFNLIAQSSFIKLTRLKFLHLSNLTCMDIIDRTIHHRLLFDLNSSNSFCSYEQLCPSTCLCCSQTICNCYSQCPTKCSCKHSYDLTINYINCSYQKLNQIPLNLPYTTTHLDLNNNQINQIESNIFSNLLNLKQLYLHHNPWIPKFSNENNQFQLNKHLILMTYGNELFCNRTIDIKRSFTYEDCCKSSNSQSCQIESRINSTNSTHISISYFDQKYLLLSLILFLLLFIGLLIVYIYRKKRILFPDENYYSNDTMKNSRQFNDNSFSYTDEDDYASIPLTISQTDLTIPVLHAQTTNVPPLPPPRYFNSHRPISHTSTTSTSITIRSNKCLNSSSITTIRSCLQIKLDVLVLYSINDSEYIHENIGQQLEYMYGKRFSFYFIHRDRMLGELDWLIENSCITILILRKPYHLIHDYMKILSTCSPIKCFIILINNNTESNTRVTLKVREKIARVYRTSDIYEWNANPNALIHEQLELFLEQNCGSATYVTD